MSGRLACCLLVRPHRVRARKKRGSTSIRSRHANVSSAWPRRDGGTAPRLRRRDQQRLYRHPESLTKCRHSSLDFGAGSGSGDQYAALGSGLGRAFQGDTPQSKLEALWTRSGCAANSSMTAASRLSSRRCARSWSRFSRQRVQRNSPATRFR